ncbi:MAG: LysM peptidoglycan-binding domain-containing protein [Nocardioidaceae bacterium]
MRRSRLSTSTRTALSGCALTVLSPFALEYVVQPGDTVSQIATEHDTTVERVVDANDLPAGGDQIYAGQTLRIPAAHARGHRPTTGTTTATTARPGDDGRRRIEWHVVRSGDTMTGIAERYHAWTDELVQANGGTSLVVGERVKVPVVVSRAGGDSTHRTVGDTQEAQETHAPQRLVRRLRARLSGYADPGHARVRRIIVRTAKREGVDPDLALAVSWQEAGWQQHHVSPDAAIGAMQVIPSTGDWVSGMVGRDLDLLGVRDNVTAGVTLLDHLTDAAASTRRAVAGYYQGLGGVREHGMYDDTRAYVANVLALKRAFNRGDHPR